MAVLPQITSNIFLYLLLCSAILATTFQGALCDTDVEGPSESECRPYIEKALKKLETGDTPEVAQEDVNLVVTENEDDSNSPPIGDVIETDDNEAALNLDQEQADQPESTQEDTESLETEGEPTENVAEDTVDEQTETEKSEEQPISKECDSETGCATETASEENREEEQVTATVSDENETAEDAQASTEATQEAEASVEQSASTEDVVEQAGSTEVQGDASEAQASLEQDASSTETGDASQEDAIEQEQSDSDKQVSAENVSAKEENSAEDSVASEQDNASVEGAVTGDASQEETQENASVQESAENTAEQTDNSAQSAEQTDDASQSVEQTDEAAQSVEQTAEAQSAEQIDETIEAQSAEQTDETVEAQSLEQTEESVQSVEQVEDAAMSVEQTEHSTQSVEQTDDATQSSEQTEEVAQSAEQTADSTQSVEQTEETARSVEDATASVEQSDEATQSVERTEEAASSVEQTDAANSVEQTETAEVQSAEQIEAAQSVEQTEDGAQSAEQTEGEAQSESTEVESEEKPTIVIDDLTFEFDIPTNLRPRDHVTEILQINEESNESEMINIKAEDSTLKELKRFYENAIKPLEVLYKYRDLSNRHFGDPEIYSKPLVLFMGPWSGGKSSIINYLLDNEYSDTSLRTGAEPSPAYFNIITHGEKTEVLDGTQLAADWTFSGLQKFGQGLEERLRGLKMPKKLLEKINIVEIPGILEVRKQVSRIFPFNDVCQWFIDRADIIFLVYDPSKLDVGPETEAILDQLKGREYQTRIILNKADQVKPEELMRVQGALIWNISPLMSSAQPPVMYSTSLWSRPYEIGAPIRLLEAQERAFLKDLKNAMDRRVENKIASARRFAVRVRNHAKMVDCYLTTYYNHKSVFGNRKLVSDQIIDHPQEYHIYEGLSTLTNISRYDLPDPDVYRDFFKLNPLYDFQQLSATCTYFRGCPINRLDIAIAYDLPELVGKYKKMTENTLDSMKATLKS